MPAEDPFLDRTILGGQFHITKKIGTGGMGSVYQAVQVEMNRLVAIKILHPKLAGRKDLASRFRREARAMSQLTHPNTVKVFMYGQLNEGQGAGSLYIVMEYLDGRNLNRAVKREGPLSVERATTILIQVCGALQEAHNAGIVHRDLKPENIFLCRQGQLTDYPKVLDFGLAKVTERQMRPGSIQLTQEGMVFGTPEFMSPEQAQGLDTLDHRADIWALGAIVFECMTGRVPFPGINGPQILLSILSKEAPPVSQADGSRFPIPPTMDPVLAKAFKKTASLRYETVGGLADAIGHAYGLEGSHRDWAEKPEAELSNAIEAQLSHLMSVVPSAGKPRSAQDSFFGEGDSLGEGMDGMTHAMQQANRALGDDPPLPELPENKKGTPVWTLVLLAVLVLAIAAAFLL